MNNHDWERFGEDIRRTIQDAVEYGNYERLNQTITNTVNQATEWMNRNVGNRGPGGPQYRSPDYQRRGYHQREHHQREHQQRTYQEGTYQQPKYQYSQGNTLYQKKASSKVGAVLLAIFGYGSLAGMAIWTALVLTASIIVGEIPAGIAMTVFNLALTGGCAFMAYKGTTTLTKIQRFQTYVKEIGTAEFCNVSALAEKVGKPTKFVVKDLEKMIQKRWFVQGHLDKQKTCLIVTDEMYRQYQQLESQKELERKEKEQKAQTQQKAASALSPEIQRVIEQGDAYVEKIRICNDKIPGEEISAKISRIEMVVDKIFDRVEQSPETVSDIRKLMDYYLPTTVKLLEAYAEMDAQPVGGENIQTAKKEIEATLDTLNIAFEKLLDSMFQDAAWDVSSDISVLNTMLAQEGLKEDGLKK